MKWDEQIRVHQQRNLKLQAKLELLELAVKNAEVFIENGVECGFVRMPDADTPDPAHDTLPILRKALLITPEQCLVLHNRKVAKAAFYAALVTYTDEPKSWCEAQAEKWCESQAAQFEQNRFGE